MTAVLGLGFLETGALPTVLAEAAVRGIALALVVGLGMRFARVRNPHIQLAVWRLVLVGALALPLLMPLAVLHVLPAAMPGVSAPPYTPFAANSFVAEPLAVASAPVEAGFDWHAMLLPLYLLVAGALLVRLLLGLALTWRLRRASKPLHETWTAGADVRLSDALHSPVTVGTTILVPADCAAWSDEQRRAVLLHERAHAARGDFHFQTLAALYRALFWFSPLAWWLHDRLADLAEVASDAEAVGALDQRTSYAAILLDFAARPRQPGLIAVAMARRETVRQRIERILTDAVIPARIHTRAQAGIAAMVVPAVLAAAVSFAQAPVTEIPLPPTVEMPAIAMPRLHLEDVQEQAERAAVRASVRLPNTAEIERITERASRLARERLKDRAKLQKSVEKAVKRQMAALDRNAVRAATDPVKESRSVGDFNAIALAIGFGDLVVTVGGASSLVLEGDAETLKLVHAEVRHGTLVIDRARGGDQASNAPSVGRITAHITLPMLKSVTLSGIGRIALAGLNGGETAIKVSGSGLVEARGRLDKLTLSISGSGKADMPNLVVENAAINISGSGDATVNSVGDLDVDISGSARVHYVGRPARLRTSISGWGTVHAL